MPDNHPTIEQLRKFISFTHAPESQLQTLSQQIEIQHASKSETIIEIGDTSDLAYFLLQGTLLLEAGDGGKLIIESHSDSARHKIANLLPRHYKVSAENSVQYLKIPNQLLADLENNVSSSTLILTEESQLATDDGNTLLSDSEYAFESEISYKLYQDLQNDKLVLPSLPDVAVRVGKAITDQTSDAYQIAEIVQSDPAITAKLVKAANSALYGGHVKVDSCSAAVVRLGMNLTHKLVLTFAVKELFRSRSGLLKRRMQALWKHSTEVAAITHVLAKLIKKFDPEHALLAGLVHDIGVLAILNYAQEFPEAQENRHLLDLVTGSLRAQVGNMILRSWSFPEGLPEVALDAEDWFRNPETGPDYSDLVIIAQLHSFIGTNHKMTLPSIDEVPAFKRLNLTQLTPRMSLKILDEAHEEITEARNLLNL